LLGLASPQLIATRAERRCDKSPHWGLETAANLSNDQSLVFSDRARIQLITYPALLDRCPFGSSEQKRFVTQPSPHEETVSWLSLSTDQSQRVFLMRKTMDARTRYAALEAACREQARGAQNEVRYWLNEADEWAQLKEKAESVRVSSPPLQLELLEPLSD
jgi:hypothetical protein